MITGKVTVTTQAKAVFYSQKCGQDTAFTLEANEMVVKTQKLWLKMLATDKANLERVARMEGESVSVIARRMIRQGVDQYLNRPARAANVGEGRNDTVTKYGNQENHTTTNG